MAKRKQMTTFCTIAGGILFTILISGWTLIIHEITQNKFMIKNNTKTHLTEWRLPIINLIIKAEFLHRMLVFTLIDRNSDQNAEIGFWDNGEWFFINKKDDCTERVYRRIMIMIMKRYPARISRLQKLVNHKQ